MKDNSLAKLGGACAILYGVAQIVGGGAILMAPPDQMSSADAAKFLPSFAQNPTMSLVNYWAIGLGMLFAIAAVLAISERVRSASECWVRWTSVLAVISFAVTAINHYRYLALYPARAAAYVAGDAATKAALVVTQPMVNLDLQTWFEFGGPGLWLLVVSWLALGANLLPKVLAYVGLVCGVALLLAFAGFVFQVQALGILGLMAGLLLGPILYIWAGVVLRR